MYNFNALSCLIFLSVIPVLYAYIAIRGVMVHVIQIFLVNVCTELNTLCAEL